MPIVLVVFVRSIVLIPIVLFFQGKPPEEQVFRCMGALSKFCSINREVATNIFSMKTLNLGVPLKILTTSLPALTFSPGTSIGEDDWT